MNPFLITIAVFLCSLGGIWLGALIRDKLPEHHLNEDSKDIVKLSTGLIATLTALVLGLLVASAKDSFQSFNDGLQRIGADVITLDRVLAGYGPEAQDARDLLRRHLITILMSNWPEDKPKLNTQVIPAELANITLSLAQPFSLGMVLGSRSTTIMTRLQDMLLGFAPKDNAQRWRQARALDISAKMAEDRWRLFEQSDSTLPVPFLVVLVIWLVILFVTFSLFAPRNKTVVTLLLLCALSVSGAVFLMLELNKPISGTMKASSLPLLKALELLGK